MTKYPQAVSDLLQSLRRENEKNVKAIAEKTQEIVDGGGLIYVFGSGHSSLIAEEAFHRAGGLIPVYPIFDDFLSPRVSPKVSGKLERLEGIAPILFARSKAKVGDMMWIASNSGINAAAIEMALECRKAKVLVVGVTSLKHSQNTKSRHSSGKKLYELCDHVLDNQCPAGDALVEIAGTRVAAGSTIANAFLFNWVASEACALWAASGKTLPVYRSANTAGGDEHNEKLEEAYRARIPLL